MESKFSKRFENCKSAATCLDIIHLTNQTLIDECGYLVKHLVSPICLPIKCIIQGGLFKFFTITFEDASQAVFDAAFVGWFILAG